MLAPPALQGVPEPSWQLADGGWRMAGTYQFNPPRVLDAPAVSDAAPGTFALPQMQKGHKTGRGDNAAFPPPFLPSVTCFCTFR